MIIELCNTNFFIYSGNTVKVYPTTVDASSTSVTTIFADDIVVQKPSIDELLSEFYALGFTIPSE